jgi:hypothetical protein
LDSSYYLGNTEVDIVNYRLRFRKTRPITINAIPNILNAVKVSLKMKNEAENISKYTNAAVRGII